jgi:hypothetical protein
MVLHVSILLKYIRTPATKVTTAITGTPAIARMPVTARTPRRPAKADTLFNNRNQSFGSGSVLGPHSIRSVDPDPYSESGSLLLDKDS